MELPLLPVMPLTIEQKLLRPGGVTPVPFEQRNDVLQNAAPPGRTTAQRGSLRPLLFRGEYAILKPADGNQRSFGSTRYDDKHVEKENLL